MPPKRNDGPAAAPRAEPTTEPRGAATNPLRSLPLALRNHFVAVVSEFIGTFLFLFFAFGATNVVNSAPDYEQPTDTNANAAKLLYISFAFGLSLLVNVWAFFRIGGGVFNPAVALALFATGSATLLRVALIIIAQLVGAVAAAALVAGLFPGPLVVSTTLAPGLSVTRGLFLEVFLTAELVFVIFMLASEKHRATYIAPVGIGLALFIAELVGVYYTGGSLNPARSFGPAVVTGDFPGYHWIYWVGPFLGALLASGLYWLIRVFEFGAATPNVDRDPAEGGYYPTRNVPLEAGADNTGRRDQLSEDTTIASPGAGTYTTGPALEAGRSNRH